MFFRGLVDSIQGWVQGMADRVIGKIYWGYHNKKWWA